MHRSLPPDPRRGFTLVEIMTVVVIIGLLVTLAVPAYTRVRERSQNSKFVNDLRIAVHAFETAGMEPAGFPADENHGVEPSGMAEALSKMTFTEETPIGGRWDWDFEQFGGLTGVSVWQPRASATRMQVIDSMIDDGNLSTGVFRARPNGYIYLIEIRD